MAMAGRQKLDRIQENGYAVVVPYRPNPDLMVVPQMADDFMVVELNSGVPFPERVMVLLRLATGPLVKMTLAVEAGEPVISGVVIERVDEAITPKAIRDITAKWVFDQVIRQVVDVTMVLARAGAFLKAGEPYRWLDEEDHAELERLGDAAVSGRRIWRAVTPQLLWQVAEIARANPGTPNKAVMKTMHTSQRNASRWIKDAKNAYPEMFTITEEG
jgi:hypothetical protein